MIQFCIILPVILAIGPRTELDKFEFREVHMGSEFKILLYAADQHTANEAAERAFGRIAYLDGLMSDYRSESEVMKLSATSGSGRKVKVSDDLWSVLKQANELSARSDGAFDVTVGPFVKLWRRARRRTEFPPEDLLAKARLSVGFRFIVLSDVGKTVQLTQDRMKLDLGGIAKGFATQAALDSLKDSHITSALVDGGGDLSVGNPPPGLHAWVVGIAPLEKNGKPELLLDLKSVSVATSGDTSQFVEIGGRRFSHIVDPATGIGLTRRMSVTVISSDGARADALASALSVMNPDKGMALIDSMEDCAAFIVELIEGKRVIRQSQRLDRYVQRSGDLQ